jgi:hypothetical protein
MGEEPHRINGGDVLRKWDICHLLASHVHTVCLAIEIHEHSDWHASPAHLRELRDIAVDDISHSLMGRQPMARATPDEVDGDPLLHWVIVAHQSPRTELHPEGIILFGAGALKV